MENWEEIIKKREEQARAQANRAEDKRYYDARVEADGNVRNVLHPFVRAAGIDTKLESIRRNVWKKGVLEVTDELEFYSRSSTGFMGNNVRNTEGWKHNYGYKLLHGNVFLGVMLQLPYPTQINVDITSVPKVSENVYGILGEFKVDPSNSTRINEFKVNFEYSLAKYCEAMQQHGYLDRSRGLII